MKRNCNLELRLVTPSVFFHSSDHGDTSCHSNMLNNMEGTESPNQEQQQQQLTIFYNGRVAACDVTEFQARAIILLASGDSSSDNNGSTNNVMSRPIIPTTGLSMKRSLQRFLEKRKTRLHSSSPYPISTTTTTHHN